MKALIWHGPREMRLDEVPSPLPAEGEVLIQVHKVGICGSELSGYLGQNSLRKPPLIMGHEFAGTVLQTGPGVAGFAPGDRVTANPMIPDSTCPLCRRGLENLCLGRRLVGAHRPGAFAEYVAIPAKACFRLPDTVDDTEGALLEPLACAIRAVELSRVSVGGSVLIVGAGPIGLLTLAVALRAGVTQAVISDTLPNRLAVARQLGAVTVNPLEQDVVKMVRDCTEGVGCDAVVDAVGLPVTRRQAIQAVRPAGRAVFVGLHEDATELPCNHVVRSEIEVTGSFCYTHANFAAAVRLAANGFLTSSRSWVLERPISEGPASFAELVDKPSTAIKVILTL